MATVSCADTFLFGQQTHPDEIKEHFPKGSANMQCMPGDKHWLATRKPHTQAFYTPKSIPKWSLLATNGATVPLNAYHFADQQSLPMKRSWGENCQLPVQSIKPFHQMTLLGSLAGIWQHGDETLPRWDSIKHMNPLHSFCLQLFWIPAVLEKSTWNPCKGLQAFVPSLYLFPQEQKTASLICRIVHADRVCSLHRKALLSWFMQKRSQ